MGEWRPRWGGASPKVGEWRPKWVEGAQDGRGRSRMVPKVGERMNKVGGGVPKLERGAQIGGGTPKVGSGAQGGFGR